MEIAPVSRGKCVRKKHEYSKMRALFREFQPSPNLQKTSKINNRIR